MLDLRGSPGDFPFLGPWNDSPAPPGPRRPRGARGGRTPASATTKDLGALLSPTRVTLRDLADQETWQLSLGRSRARRRATELQFVPTSSRAKRVSLGALAALTVGPTASIASGAGTSEGTPSEPATTTEHLIVLSEGAEGRQVQLLQRALGISADGIFGPETQEAV